MNREHCAVHSYYEEFVNQLKKLHLEIINKEITKYDLSCYLRWMAYATQADDLFYVSDYDVINNSFPMQIPEEGLTFLDGNCPCFASGRPKDFDLICKLFIEITTNRLKELQQANIVPCYHDQMFLVHNHNYIDPKYNIKFIRNRKIFVGDIVENMKDYQLAHLSHSCCHTHTRDRTRTETAKEICSKYFDLD